MNKFLRIRLNIVILGFKRQRKPKLSWGRDVTASPDVLAIADCSLGFRDTPENWPAALRQGGRPEHVILTTVAPLFQGQLWGHLLKVCGDRLTVVVSADTLRSYGAAIRAPLSWDATIEETTGELLGERFANRLALVRRVVVVFGTDGAASFTRLPLHGTPGGGLSERVQFERCLYDPDFLEGTWAAKRPGLVRHTVEIGAAALVRQVLDPGSYPLYVALGRALAAAREYHAKGAGSLSQSRPDLSMKYLSRILHPEKGEPASTYFTAFPHGTFDDTKLRARPATQSDLLEDFTGAGLDSVVSTGVDVVLRGPEVALKPVPKANFGKYFTVDRSEIECLNSVRNLIVTYLSNSKDTRPLSFAVFGPPGSGKSFAVKELMRDVAGDSASGYDFNLSQMAKPEDLHTAFHRIRNAATQGRMPFVFWDEFDTGDLKWLKDFLCPMQDAQFHAGGMHYPFGKAIFVFAGGTSASLAEFHKKPDAQKPDTPEYDHFKKQKGPDFVSRLRGHIDVKGPNPEAGASGHAHIIRRAIMLRSHVRRHAPHLLDPISKHLAIDASVVRAFLSATRYEHGARSIESIVSMSNLAKASQFGAAALPSSDLLRLHVTADFETGVRELLLGLAEIEVLAIATHDAYRAKIVPGPEPNPNDVCFDKLPDNKKESNRSSVRSTLTALVGCGYRLVRGCPNTPSTAIPPHELQRLQRLEHDRWLRELLQSGWTHGPKSPALRLNPNILPFDELPNEVRPLDLATVQAILKYLPELGYSLVKLEQNDTHA